MTRINSHKVIQMVGDDRLVFVDDHSGEEVVITLNAAVDLLMDWAESVTQGERFSPGGTITFDTHEYDAVSKTIEYFVECSQMTPQQQEESIQVFTREPGETLEEMLARAGIDKGALG